MPVTTRRAGKRSRGRSITVHAKPVNIRLRPHQCNDTRPNPTNLPLNSKWRCSCGQHYVTVRSPYIGPMWSVKEQ